MSTSLDISSAQTDSEQSDADLQKESSKSISNENNEVASDKPHLSEPEATQESRPNTTGAPSVRKTDKRIKPANVERVRKLRRKSIIKWLTVSLVMIVVLAVLGYIATFCYLRWNKFDDAADIEGTWQVKGTSSLVKIENGTFYLTDDIAYNYEINPKEKTLTFNFGTKDGSARYRFSLNRNELAIEDGTFSESQTFPDDFAWSIDANIQKLINNVEVDPSFGKGDMTLERIN